MQRSHHTAPPALPPRPNTAPQALLSSPQPDDPQDAVVARQYLSSLEQYSATARQWTDTYAHVVRGRGRSAWRECLARMARV